jgi:hypothetical protein
MTFDRPPGARALAANIVVPPDQASSTSKTGFDPYGRPASFSETSFFFLFSFLPTRFLLAVLCPPPPPSPLARTVPPNLDSPVTSDSKQASKHHHRCVPLARYFAVKSDIRHHTTNHNTTTSTTTTTTTFHRPAAAFQFLLLN